MRSQGAKVFSLNDILKGLLKCLLVYTHLLFKLQLQLLHVLNDDVLLLINSVLAPPLCCSTNDVSFNSLLVA